MEKDHNAELERLRSELLHTKRLRLESTYNRILDDVRLLRDAAANGDLAPLAQDLLDRVSYHVSRK